MLVYMVAFVDRQILSLLVEPIKRDFGASDTQIGLLAGFAFAIFYTLLGVPIARLADKKNRKGLICAGIVVWSIMTAACGLSKTYWQLFLMRVGVGVGEATLSPAAYSIIADYFPPQRLAKAVGVYAMGLYLGAGVALLVGSAVVALVSGEEAFVLPIIGMVYPWQLTFLVVALPGLAVLALMMTVKEPPRTDVGATREEIEEAEKSTSIADLAGFFRGNKRLLTAHFGGFMCLGTVVSAYLVWTPELFRRTYGFSVAEGGFVFGMCLVLSGGVAPFLGGWFSEWLLKRGYQDAEMRAGVIFGVLMLPCAVFTPLVDDARLSVLLLALLTFTLAVPQALPPTILQLIAPNRMRAQLSAVFILFGVLVGFSVGPALTAVLTDYLFRDAAALRYSLALLSVILVPAGIAFLVLGLKPYAEKLAPTRPMTV
jgi:MFS family permease